MNSRSRMDLAKSAAKAVLLTLTWVDMVAIIAFSSNPWVSTASLVPATTANKRMLESFIDRLSPEGGTNFVDALDTAMDLLISVRRRPCLTAECIGVLLFLTDGEPDSWRDDDYNRLRRKNSDGYVKIFGYALGNGANRDIPRRLAHEHGGEFHAIEDGGNLKNAMASYYKVIARQYMNTDLVRWIVYADAITGEELLAGCLPLYDRRNPSTPLLLGVTCMDLNMIADISTLRRSASWNDFADIMEADSRRCTSSAAPRVLTKTCQAEWLKASRRTANLAVRSAAPAFAALLAAAASLLPLAVLRFE
mmetsp:Transcript_20475/g.64233  ORF Transcript_20475/g.64233 Transcript_20475/m.64233 type:complete len:307 (+) Transcript_20475:1-921(+)